MSERNRDPAIPETGEQVPPRVGTIRAAGTMRRLMDWTPRQKNCGTLRRIRLLESVRERSRRRQSSTALI
jgi:hypothetical protein